MDTSEYAPEPHDGLAGRIRAYRLRHGMTQRDLADQLGVTQQSVARWEQGSPPSRHLFRALEVLVDEPAADEPSGDLADIIGIRPPAAVPARTRGVEEARRAYVQGCLKLLERGERLPDKVLLLLAGELGWTGDD
ncbi:MAG TPA: helix-turn-helix transcriptional regulator [Acidimicrobiales bacterium]|nr:helix-turn-helix transcriptional regulator [Acidimicrobiales bacterium]